MADYHKDNAVFLVYKDWETLFDSLDSNEEAGELIKALFAFAKRGEMAEFSGALKMAFIFMSQQLERDGRKWEDTCERRAEYGKKGGKAKAEKQKLAKASTSYQKQAKEADTVTDTDKDTDKDTDTVTDTVTDTEKELQAATPHPRFIPPTVEEVAEYCRERNNCIDAEAFVAFYGAKGWMIGKNKMKDWKKAIITWEKRQKALQSEQPKSNIPTEDEYDVSKYLGGN